MSGNPTDSLTGRTDCETVEREDILERYLLGRLSEHDRVQFEEHYFECGECFANLQALQAVRRELLKSSARDGASRRRMPRWVVPAAVAATLLLAIAASVWMRSSTMESVPTQTSGTPMTPTASPETPSSPGPDVGPAPSLDQLARVEPAPYEPATLRGVEDEAMARFRRGMARYRLREYAAAVAELRSAADLNPGGAHIPFFLGVSHLLLGEHDAAVDRLKAVIALGDSPYLEEAHWYLAKALLRRGDVAGGRTQLTALIRLNGTMRDEAQQLLVDLERIERLIDASARPGLVALMLVAMLADAGYSQETTGTIFGALTDQTGAVLPGVRVVISSIATGQVREAVTNSTGQYSVSLPIGNYEISFLLPDFQLFTARGISLHVNDRLQVNGRLLVGAVETLTVTAERLVQPTSAVQYLIPSKAVSELPLLSRTPIQLVTLVPGVSSDLREDACFCDQGNLNVSINGARRSAVNWLLDGASNVNGWNNYTLVTTPSLETIAEITSSRAATRRNGRAMAGE